MKMLHRAIAVLFALVLTAACGPSPANNPRASAPLTVEVSNANRRDITVFLVRSGTPVRLGIVVSGRTQTFNYNGLPAGTGESIRLNAQIIGSGDQYSSDLVRVNGGERVVLRLEDLLSSSSISVRR